MRVVFSLVAFGILAHGLVAQEGPVAFYSFDNCTVADETGNYGDVRIADDLSCGCGVGTDSDGFYFDGSDDTLFLDNKISEVLNTGDFTVSFYFWVEDAATSYSMMSIREGCDRDSSFIVQYLPSTNEVILEFTRNIAEGIFFRTKLDANRCWHHLTFTREGDIYALYLDGSFVQSAEFLTPIQVGPDYDFTVGYSPCVGITDQYFDGRIDEIRFYDYAFREEDIFQILEFPDEILTRDTTIFLGDEVIVQAGSSCAANISWLPSAGVSNPSVSAPILSPEETTLYEINFNHGTCSSRDSLLISVIDAEDIECNNLLLPTAFTPNNDGINDLYGISNRFVVENISRFEIYNRWGMLLFRGMDKNDRWDGRYEGEFQPPGTYIYKIEYACMGETYSKAGSFNIIR